MSHEDDETAQRAMDEGSEASEESEAPMTYEQHLEIIRSLREKEEWAQLRDARMAMHEDYPLTEQMWIEWLDDEEAQLDLDDGNQIAFLLQLYTTAHSDYRFASLYLRQANFVKSCLEKGLAEESNVEEIFDAAVEAVGLDVRSGREVWDAYLSFERDLVDLYLSEENPDMGKVNEKKEKVAQVYEAMMKVPFGDMEPLLTQYQMDTKSGSVENAAEMCQSTSKVAAQIQPYEESVHWLRQDTPNDHAYATWKAYVDFSEENMESEYTIALLERAVALHCMNKEIWCLYLDIIEKDPMDADCIGIYERCLRNYPWSGQLWARFLRALERLQESMDEVTKTYHKAMGSPFPAASEAMTVSLAFVDYLRRNLREAWGQEAAGSDELDAIREILKEGADHISEKFPQDSATLAIYLMKWADFEAHVISDFVAATTKWEQGLQVCPSYAELWLDYARHYRMVGLVDETRAILKRAAGTQLDYPISVTTFWLDFEREAGTLSQYADAIKSCKEVDDKYALLQQQQQMQYVQTTGESSQGTFDRKPKGKKPTTDKSKDATSNKKDAPPKKKDLPSNKAADKTPKPADPAKRQRDGDGFAMPTPKKPKAQETSEVGDSNKSATVQSDATSEPPAVKQPPPQKPMFTEAATLFVRHIDFSVSEADLHDLFGKFGDIKDVRLKRGHKGDSKGFAYIEYAQQGSADNALVLHNTELKGRKMDVFLSKPPTKEEKERKKQEQLQKATAAAQKSTPSTTTKPKIPTMMVPPSVKKAARLDIKPKSNASEPRSEANAVMVDETPTTTATQSTNAPKSNADFRKMFLSD